MHIITYFYIFIYINRVLNYCIICVHKLRGARDILRFLSQDYPICLGLKGLRVQGKVKIMQLKKKSILLLVFINKI